MRLGYLICLPLLVGTPLAVAAKPCVVVDFQVSALRYSDEYFPAELDRIEKTVRGYLVENLNQYLTFLDFGKAEDFEEPCGSTLVFDLVEKLDGAKRFRVSLDYEPPEGRPPAEDIEDWILPDKSFGGLRLGTVDQQIDDFEVALPCEGTKKKCQRYDRLVAALLSELPIAEGGDFRQVPAGFVLPFGEADVCLGLGTQLEVECDVAQVIDRYTGRTTPMTSAQQMFCRADAAAVLGQLPADQVQVLRIRVQDLQPSTFCQPESPEEVLQ